MDRINATPRASKDREYSYTSQPIILVHKLDVCIYSRREFYITKPADGTDVY